MEEDKKGKEGKDSTKEASKSTSDDTHSVLGKDVHGEFNYGALTDSGENGERAKEYYQGYVGDLGYYENPPDELPDPLKEAQQARAAQVADGSLEGREHEEETVVNGVPVVKKANHTLHSKK